MTNDYRPHLMVIPEDDANRQLANGFQLAVQHQARMQVLRVAGGWRAVLDRFKDQEATAMRKYPRRHMVLLLDFDNQDNRPEQIKNEIPDDLKESVFVLGVQSDPETLKRAVPGSLENIGSRLAIECREKRRDLWAHELLAINSDELERLQQIVWHFLF